MTIIISRLLVPVMGGSVLTAPTILHTSTDSASFPLFVSLCLPALSFSRCGTRCSSFCAVSGGCPGRGIHHPNMACTVISPTLHFFDIHHGCNISALRAYGNFCSRSKSIIEKSEIKQYLVELPYEGMAIY